MTIERLANYPYPKDISTVEDVKKYLERQYGSLVTESGDRILDFDILQLSNVPWVDVREYGATGDGVTDDTAAIQAAATAAAGSMLFFPEPASYYYLSDEITLSSYTHVSGQYKPDIRQVTSGKKIFIADTKTHIKISGLHLTGRGAQTTYTANEDIIRLDDCTDIIIDNLLIEEVAGAYGICLKNCTRAVIEKNTIDEFSYAGIMTLAVCSDIYISKNTVRDCVGTGVNSYGIAHGNEDTTSLYGARIYYLYNYVYNVPLWEGLDFHGGDDIYMIGNVVKECRTPLLVALTVGDEPARSLSNVYIRDNTLECASDGVYTLIVQGNVGCTEPYARNVHIENNVCKYGNTKDSAATIGGISVNYIDGLDIVNNKAIQNVNAGIFLYHDVINFHVSGNLCKDNYGGTYESGIQLQSVGIRDGIIENNIFKWTGNASYVQEYGIGVTVLTNRVLERNNIANVKTAKYRGADFYIKQEHAPTAPTAGSWEVGDIEWEETPAGSATPGWVCIHSGTFGAATDNTGDTTNTSSTITGMTDTSDFFIGNFVDVSAGFATTGPYEIIAITATSITLKVSATSSESNVTVDTSDPTFKAMANLAA